MSSDNQPAKFPHFFLQEWPFQVVPDENSSTMWADRSELKETIDRLMWHWGRNTKSAINLMWADLGAGKTHTLKYIAKSLTENENSQVIPIYAVMPRQLSGFVDVYKAVIAGLDLEQIGRMTIEALRKSGSRRTLATALFPNIPDALSALQSLQSEHENIRRVAAQWLRASKELTKRDLNSIEVTQRIRTTDDAVFVISGLLKIMMGQGGASRIVVMLDEAQRLGEFKSRIGSDVSIGLQTWFDATPNGLSLILSFGSGKESFVRHLLSPELQSREDTMKLRIPLLDYGNAIIFVEGVLSHHRSESPPTKWYPFTEDQVETLIAELTNRSNVTPRDLMKVFNAALREADFLIGTGRLNDLSDLDLIKIGLDALSTRDEDEDDQP